MICILLVVAANLAALSSANNPFAPIESLSTRQATLSCNGISIPERCTQASTDYAMMVQQATNMPSPDSSRRIVNFTRTALDIICSNECVAPTLRLADCINNELARNLTHQACSRNEEDGTFCQVKVLEEVARNGSTSPLPICISRNTNGTARCDSLCRQSYLDARNRLGCCAASWYGSFGSLSALGQNFATCNVSLSNPCTLASAATTIFIDFLLIAAVFLLSMTMI